MVLLVSDTNTLKALCLCNLALGFLNPSTTVATNIVRKLHRNGYSMMSETSSLGIIGGMVGCTC